ncbi:hypothetical protein DFA_08899 [Cavenderia fasciculata]|uniref:Transmembrane protein n=1 Tax=Cavenderia fasciculata TaxID=261658 RepID=F4Q4V2_CACFS|nr:uncharacterized protein DFA_08899 [Cavenderia fasciculata]EGG17898.1 hypothetical protein DFA_08899 [Cavenderia fasciculata]|eukprot:XP_004356382.1 hypothetical protein DFA_08899 [Cavenderia fasciculata]
MFKLLSSVLLLVFVSSILLSSNGVHGGSVTQTNKTLVINFNPNNMMWTAQQLRNKGVITNIAPYCTQNGNPPMICNLPTMPACDSIRLYGMSAIGIGTVSFSYPFNCTVIA